MSELLDDNIEQQPDLVANLNKLQNYVFRGFVLCLVAWFDIRLFFLDKIIKWSRPIVDDDVYRLFLQMAYILFFVWISAKVIRSKFPCLEKTYFENSNGIFGNLLLFFVLGFLGALFFGISLMMFLGISGNRSIDIVFVMAVIGNFIWLHRYFKNLLLVQDALNS